MEYKQIKAIEWKNKQRWLERDKTLTDCSGIYVLERTDEEGFKFAYVGQAKHILTRLAQHLSGYQWVDLSIKKHGLFGRNNIYGWDIYFVERCPEELLDEREVHWIKQMAKDGYQLRNQTSGGQDSRKSSINSTQSTKNYHQGIEQGRKNERKYIKEMFEKYLEPKIKGSTNKIKERKLKEFLTYLEES